MFSIGSIVNVVTPLFLGSNAGKVIFANVEIIGIVHDGYRCRMPNSKANVWPESWLALAYGAQGVNDYTKQLLSL